MRLIVTWRPSKSFIWVQIPAGVPKMTEYDNGLTEGLNIAKDVAYWYDDLEVIRKKIKEKISLAEEIKNGNNDRL